MKAETMWKSVAPFFLCLLLVQVEAQNEQSIVSKQCDASISRLPENVRPSHYDLRIEPSLAKLDFVGHVKINLELGGEEPIHKLMLNAHPDLNIDEVELLVSATQRIEVSGLCSDTKYEMLVIDLTNPLPPNSNATLSIRFHAKLRSDTSGFYYSTYQSHSEIEYLLVTQFEPVEARKALPCFDEPAFKATYQVTLVHDKELTALSNTEVEHQDPQPDGRLLVRFARTPKMSSYLLAFIVGKFEQAERTIKSGQRQIQVRAFTSLGHSKHAVYALETASRSIEMMEDYFGIAFPLNKLDLVAIPDFSAGAMENWGLILFRETMILVDDDNTEPMAKAVVAITVIHEIAHQWFGNLVTMHWWDDLWLNEGFATWMSYFILDKVRPELNSKQMFITENMIGALETDANARTHPIISSGRQTDTRDQIEKLFDDITYLKSSSVIWYLHDDYIDANVFKEGLRDYMHQYQYSNTRTIDLLRAIVKASRVEYNRMIGPWLRNPGYPLLTVDYIFIYNSISIHMSRFFDNLSKDVPGKRFRDLEDWIIPINIMVSSPERQETMHHYFSNEFNRPMLKLPGWFNSTLGSGHFVKLNVGFAGFYRVKYSDTLLQLLESPVRARKLSPADRLDLISSALALWSNQELAPSRFVQLLTWFEGDTDGSVLSQLVRVYQHMEAAQSERKAIKRLQKFFVKLLGEHLSNSLFISDETTHVDYLDEVGLGEVFMKLVAFDWAPAQKLALSLFESQWKVRPVLRRAVYLAVARKGSDENFDRLLEELQRTESREERNRIALALAGSIEEIRLKRLWNMINGNSHLKFDFSMLELKEVMSYYGASSLFLSELGHEKLVDGRNENPACFIKLMKPALLLVKRVIQAAKKPFSLLAKKISAEQRSGLMIAIDSYLKKK